MNGAANCLSLHHDMAMVQMIGKEQVFSLANWKDKVNPSKTPQNKDKTENRVAKRKLYSPGALSEDEDKKVTPKRRRSVAAGESPSGGGGVTPGVNGGGGVKVKTPNSVHGTPRISVPLSERQQLALLMQMTAGDDQTAGPDAQSQLTGASGPLSPHSVGRRTPADKKLNKRNERGETPLHVAAIRGDVKQMKKLIKNGADVNIKDYAGWTPLHEACNHGWYDVARQLLNAGADVNIRGLDNDTPLHDASVNGHTKLVKLLLSCGANGKLINARGKTPLDVAANEDIVRLLRGEDHQMSPAYSDTDSAVSSNGQPMSPASVGGMSPKPTLEADTRKYTNSRVSPSNCGVTMGMYSPTGSYRPNSCTNRRAPAPHGPTTPPSASSGVLKNVLVSHHMDRSSSTPRLTLKFHHVKRHENGVSVTDRQLADSRLHGVTEVSPVQSSALHVASGLKQSGLQVSPTDSRRTPTSSPLCNGRHPDDDRDKSRPVVDSVHWPNGFVGQQEGNAPTPETRPAGEDRQAASAPLSTPFSPQFEDISDAEDDSRPASLAPLSSAPMEAASMYGIPQLTHIAPLTAGLYAPPGVSPFYSTTATAMPTLPLVGWTTYGRFGCAPAASLISQPSSVPQVVGGHSYFVPPWMAESRVPEYPPVLCNPYVGSSVGGAQISNMRPLRLEEDKLNSVQDTVCVKKELSPSKTDNVSNSCTTLNADTSRNVNMAVKPEVSVKVEACSGVIMTDDATKVDTKPLTDVSTSSSDDSLITVKGDTSSSVKDESFELCKQTVDAEAAVSSHSGTLDCMSSAVNSSALSASPLLDSTPALIQDSSDVMSQLNSDAARCEPKVPPLRIIIPPKSCPAGSVTDGGNTTTAASSLPYVVSHAHSLAENDTSISTVDTVAGSHCSPIPTCSSMDTDAASANCKDAQMAQCEVTRRRKVKQAMKPKDDDKPSQAKSGVEVNTANGDNPRLGAESEDSTANTDAPLGRGQTSASAAERRVTRAAARSQQQKVGKHSASSSAASTATDTSQSGEVEKEGHSAQVQQPQASEQSTSSTSVTRDDDANNGASASQRKHKKLQKIAVPLAPEAPVIEAQVSVAPVQPYRKPVNPYAVYRNIKKKVIERKKGLCTVVPKPPARFSEYALVTKRYVLNSGILSGNHKLPTRMPVPSSLVGPLRELFILQEEARYQLQLQHITERDRLTLLAEQETLRVHCHSAQAAANFHSGALGVCPLLSYDLGLWGGSMSVIHDAGSTNGNNSGDSAHEDREQRSRCGSRHFISWMQDVYDKFERLKDEMRLRHHHEADVLCAIQRLDWEWKLREVGAATTNCTSTTPPGADVHVRRVPVDDELVLVPL